MSGSVTQPKDKDKSTDFFDFFDKLIDGSKRRHKKEVEQVVSKDVEYETRRREADTILSQAEEQPGMQSAAKTFAERLTKLDTVPKDKQPELLELCIAGLEKAKVDRNKRVDQLNETAKPQFVLVSSILQITGGPDFPKTRGEHFRRRAEELQEELFSPTAKLKDIGEHLKTLKGEAELIGQTYAMKARVGREQIDEVRKQLEPITASDKTASAPVLGRLLRAEALYANGEHDDADELVESGKADAEDLLEESRTAAEQWTTLQDEVSGLLLRANTLVTGASPILATGSPAPGNAVTLLSGLADGVKGGKLRPADAVKRVTAAQVEIDENEERAAAYERLGDVRTTNDKAVQEALTAFHNAEKTKRELMNGVVRRSDTEDTILSAIEPQSSAVDTIAKGWATLLSTATTADALASDPVAAQIAVHTQAVEKMSPQGSGFANALAGEKLKSAKPQFEKARQECETKLGELEPLGSGDYATFSKRLADSAGKIAETSGKPGEPELVKRETEALKQLAADLGKAIETAAGAAKEAKAKLEKPMKEVEFAFKELEKLHERMGESWLTKAPEYKGVLDLLRNDNDGIASVLAGTNDLDIVNGLLPSINELKTRIANASSAINGTAPKGAVTLQSLNESITTDGASLKAAVLTEYAAASKQRLSDELDAIKGNVGKIAMDKSKQALDAWEQRRQTAYNDALKAQTAFAEFKKAVEEQEKALNALKGDAFADAPDYVAALVKRLAALKASGKAEGGLASAQQQLDFLKQEIEDAKDPASRADRNDAAKSVSDQAIKDAKRWELEYAEFQKTTLGGLESAKVGAALRKNVAELGKQADQNFKTSKDYTTARQMLNAAIDKAKVALAMPEGMETLRKTLVPEALAGWRNAIEAMRLGMAELAAKVDEAEPGAKGEVEKVLTELRAQFNAGIFDGPCKAFAAPGADEKVRRAARETALQEVRRVRALLDKDPRAGALMRNPFVKPFKPIHAMSVAVNKIEKTLLLGF